jgi:elongation factor 4
MELSKIRNFSIIAHIDHGKSTLADRLLELTGTVEKRKMKEQVLDSMDLERERGITIKMQPARMEYDGYILNLIDTPGHVDFSYEVSRALLCCEGAILLVDATQGIQAQTLSHFYVAKKLGLKLIPVLNKIDLVTARPDEVAEELQELGGFDEDEIYRISAKDGSGVEELLNGIIEKVPPPKGESGNLRALVFDSYFESHKGVIAHVRIFDGEIKKTDQLFLKARELNFIAKELGHITPERKDQKVLHTGEVGYVVTGIKKPGEIRVGDTIIELKKKDSKVEALPGYKEPSPVVWASFFPTDQGDFFLLQDALSKLRLNDASFTFEEKKSLVLGRGFECGFLGTLHLEVAAERLRREFNIEFVVTHPSVSYKITKNGKVETVSSAAQFPRKHECESMEELWMKMEILTPRDQLQSTVKAVEAFEGYVGSLNDVSASRLQVEAKMPLRSMVNGFFSALKSATHGFASFHYEAGEWKSADLVRLDLLVAEERVEALSRVVRSSDAEREARAIVDKVKDVLPQELFVIKIQGEVEGRILASQRIAALKKDVTGYLYGGDRSRKMKLWKKQKAGKKKLQAGAKVTIAPDIYIKLLKIS